MAGASAPLPGATAAPALGAAAAPAPLRRMFGTVHPLRPAARLGDAPTRPLGAPARAATGTAPSRPLRCAAARARPPRPSDRTDPDRTDPERTDPERSRPRNRPREPGGDSRRAWAGRRPGGLPAELAVLGDAARRHRQRPPTA